MIDGLARVGLKKILELVAEESFSNLTTVEEKLVGKAAPLPSEFMRKKTRAEIIENILNNAESLDKVLHTQKVSKYVLMKYLKNEGIFVRDDIKKSQLWYQCRCNWSPLQHTSVTNEGTGLPSEGTSLPSEGTSLEILEELRRENIRKLKHDRETVRKCLDEELKASIERSKAEYRMKQALLDTKLEQDIQILNQVFNERNALFSRPNQNVARSSSTSQCNDEVSSSVGSPAPNYPTSPRSPRASPVVRSALSLPSSKSVVTTGPCVSYDSRESGSRRDDSLSKTADLISTDRSVNEISLPTAPPASGRTTLPIAPFQISTVDASPSGPSSQESIDQAGLLDTHDRRTKKSKFDDSLRKTINVMPTESLYWTSLPTPSPASNRAMLPRPPCQISTVDSSPSTPCSQESIALDRLRRRPRLNESLSNTINSISDDHFVSEDSLLTASHASDRTTLPGSPQTSTVDTLSPRPSPGEWIHRRDPLGLMTEE